MKSEKNIIAVFVLLAIAAFARLMPHIPNFTPTEGVVLFGSAYLSRKYLAWILPVVMLYLSDFVLNNTVNRIYFTNTEGLVLYSDYMLFNAIALIFIVLFGSLILKKITVFSTFGGAIGASVIFFLVSNFGVWLSSGIFYSKDLTGLMSCYIAGWPFFRTTLLSNLVFVTIIFGSFEMYKMYAASGKRTKA
ncbi:MAG: hypothetical protein IPM42_15750 [Saprospiraceae bacterium]|nr:hypothetical protein [Saprospiraceae bacterium]